LVLLGWLPGRSLLVELPLRERIKRFDPSPSPFPLSSHTHNTPYTGIYIGTVVDGIMV